jgi:hypothetical protein
MPLTPGQRKKNERERKKSLGITTVSTDLSCAQLEKLENLCEIFGDNKTGNYSKDELISTLIDKAHAQSKNMGKCSNCKELLPKGCNGIFKGDSRCEKKYLSQVNIKLI